MHGLSSTLPRMTPNGTGGQTSSQRSTGSNRALHWHQSSYHWTPPDPSRSRLTAQTSLLEQSFLRSAQLTASATLSHSSPNLYHQSNATMRSMTRRCLQLYGPCRNGTTLSKGLNTNLRSGLTTKIWSTSCQPSSSTEDRHGGHCTFPGLTSFYTINLASPWANQMHSRTELTTALVKVTTPILPSSPPSSLPSEPWKAFRLLVWRWISSRTFTKAAETQRRSWSLKQSRNFASHPPGQSIPKNGLFRMACYTSMVAFMSH